MPPWRILVVDDSVVIRKVVGDVVSEDPELELIGTAANGRIALSKIDQLKPDLVTLDVEMPVLGGLETLEVIRREHPDLPVIMFSGATARGASITLDALSMGARDYALKPSERDFASAKEQLRTELLVKIKNVLGGATRRSLRPAAQAPAAPPPPPPVPALRRPSNAEIRVVAIGVSTGGPNALEVVLPQIPESFPLPILITQHMPPIFTRSLAQRLDNKSRITVVEGEEGMEVQPGWAYLAPGGFHMVAQRSGTSVKLHLNEEPPENFCRPAVDPMFRSIAQAYHAGVLGVILTGMGRDGLEGCRVVLEEGGRVIAQDEATSVVWGMPGFVARAGYAEKVLPIGEIATNILAMTARASTLQTVRS